MTLLKTALSTCGICNEAVCSVHFKCAECSPEIDLCGRCLREGRELPGSPHKKWHCYRVIPCRLNTPLFTSDWTAEQELQLIEGIESHGVGNWNDIANVVNGKTAAECSQHYTTIYLESKDGPLPSKIPNPMRSVVYTEADANEVEETDDVLVPVLPPLSQSMSKRGQASMGGRRSGVLYDTTPSQPTDHLPRSELAGYYPLRGDFEVEYDNEAEHLIADIEFTDGENPVETELKLKMIEIYNAKLDERERRKAFVIERGLLDFRRLAAIEKRRPKEEREIYDVMRPFARFLSPQEFEDLVRGLILEQRLRRRIALLQEQRKSGVRTAEEVEEFLRMKRQRELQASAKKTLGAFSSDARASATPANRRMRKADDEAPLQSKKKRQRESQAGSTAGTGSSAANGGSSGGLLLGDELSQDEALLCSHLGLQPAQFAQIKCTLYNIAVVNGMGAGGAPGLDAKAEATARLTHIEAAKIGGVYDFVIKCGFSNIGADGV